ncbi:MAG: T9SS type A sorting domain-containing protein [Bacteroidales bacterium]|nr:T9SS type A sorting domain-containing protein [Bacteroidales bacterium]
MNYKLSLKILFLILTITGFNLSSQTVLVKNLYVNTGNEYISCSRTDGNGYLYFFVRSYENKQRGAIIYKTDGTTNNTVVIKKMNFYNNGELIEGAGGVVYYFNDSCYASTCKYYLRAYNSNNNKWTFIAELKELIAEVKNNYILIDGWLYYIQKEGIFRTRGEAPEKILTTDIYYLAYRLSKFNDNLIISNSAKPYLKVFNTTTGTMYDVAATSQDPNLELNIYHIFEINNIFYIINKKKDEKNTIVNYFSQLKTEKGVITGIEYLHSLPSSLPYTHQTGVAKGKFFFDDYDKLYVYNPATNAITDILNHLNSLTTYFKYKDEMYLVNQYNLWKSNGTSSGTLMLNNEWENEYNSIYTNGTGAFGSYFYKSFAIYNNSLFFIGKREKGEEGTGYGLRSTDGTPGKTIQEDNIKQLFSFYEMNVINDKLLILCRVDDDYQLRRYDKNATSVINPFNHQKFTITPNPAKDIISIKTGFLPASPYIKIYNSFGSLVKSETIKNTQKTININDLPTGIYIIEIKTNDWTDRQKILIIK